MSDRTLTILYATETGTAQDAANRIARACRLLHLVPRVLDMAHYPLARLPFSPRLLLTLNSLTSSTNTYSCTSCLLLAVGRNPGL
jgi:sulfite reductase alpha subunit-like flavoprotein